ncbi:hypothetical protein FRX31_026526 [Thalictrum thalictroides]|uniref:Reverse transcriptase zinc-binding domain-containing protein n=1 Tax=Thalictrum thalictroides TaxID=46969 RepID=A0A7J6VI42_THATH|nr:hypothetical protein FRX31_026526 [Thalictrum thalictroides]
MCSMYDFLLNSDNMSNGLAQLFPSKLVWRKQLTPMVQFFFWQVLLGRVLTKNRLIHCGTLVNPICDLCNLLNEDIGHLFLHCPLALEVCSSVFSPRKSDLTLILCSDSVEEVLGNWPVSRGTVFGRRVWSMLPYSVLWVL